MALEKDKTKVADKAAKAEKKPRAAAFVNWETILKDGRVLKSDKGFALFQNPKFPNPKEDLLIEAAKLQEDNTLEITLVCKIILNKPEEEAGDKIIPADLFAVA